MKFIDKIINSYPDNNIYWLWNSKISKYIHLLNLSYDNAIIKYNSYKNVIKDILKFYNKKKKYPSIFIFVNPLLDINFYRLIIEIKDGLILYKKKIISYDTPYVFIIAHMEPVPKMITIHKFIIYYMNDQ